MVHSEPEDEKNPPRFFLAEVLESIHEIGRRHAVLLHCPFITSALIAGIVMLETAYGRLKFLNLKVTFAEVCVGRVHGHTGPPPRAVDGPPVSPAETRRRSYHCRACQLLQRGFIGFVP